MAIKERGFKMKTLNFFMILVLGAANAFADSETDHMKRIVDMFIARLPQEKYDLLLLKQGCDQVVLTSKADGAYAEIEDYNKRFTMFLASGYYYETDPDTTEPIKGLFLDYKPSADQTAIFPGLMGVWYQY